MNNIEVQIDTFKGTHYEYGVHQAKKLMQTPYFKNRDHEWKKRRPKFNLDLKETKAMYEMYAPFIWEEIIGLKDTLKINDDYMLQNLAHYRTNPRPSGCSVYVDEKHFIRNYDYHPNTYDGYINLYEPTDSGYLTLAPVSRVTGRMDGINENGLIMGYNFMNRKEPEDGFVCFMIGRFILELCKDVSDAKHLLKEIDHRGGFTYILKDKNEEYTIAETSGRDIAFRKDNVCTNHYLKLTDENRHFVKESKERLKIANMIHHPNKKDLEKYFTEKEFGLFVDNYKSWAGTIHTTYYDSEALSMNYRLGNGDFHTLSIKDYWKKEKFPKKIASIIDTDLRFTNVDWE